MVSFTETFALAKKAAESEFLAKTTVLLALAEACDRAQEKLPDDDAYKRWALVALEGFKAQLATILDSGHVDRPRSPPPAYVERPTKTTKTGPEPKH